MSPTASPVRHSTYDPNRLFDDLLRSLNLENDEALSQRLNISRALLLSVRRGERNLDAPLLVRISEHCGIAVRDLRKVAGDRRGEYRLDRTSQPAQSPREHQRRPRRHKDGLLRDDAGLPNSVQWT